jgi:hypothetical protein
MVYVQVGIGSDLNTVINNMFELRIYFTASCIRDNGIRSCKFIQHKLADMATKIETARLLTYKAA